MKKIIWGLLVIVFILPHNTLAASGTPNSNSFGYGVRVDLLGASPHSSIQEAGKFNLDWIAIDLNWQHFQSDEHNLPAWEEMDAAFELASQNQLSVMLSITQAPHWAMGQDGPSSDKTGRLISDLVSRYSDELLAIEIFPSANTLKGWGTTPNPSAYTHLLRSVAKITDQISPDLLIVGAGLAPVESSSEGMDDLIFLSEIYREGIAEYMPIVGLRLPPLGSDPLAQAQNSGQITLRHYEDIRSIMVAYGHKNGLIWITGFSWDAETIGSQDEQAAWMKQAYLLFRSQLYIGAAYFDSLNPSQNQASTLLFQGGGFHPGFEELIQVIAIDHNQQTIIIKNELFKKITSKNYPKAKIL